jgi:hypothetical protein
MSAVTPEQPRAELAIVEVSVESGLVEPEPGTGGFGRVTIEVPLAPIPNTITSGHGPSGIGLEVHYRDAADADAIESTAQTRGEPVFSVPGIPGVVKITGKHPSHDGRATVFSAVDASRHVGDNTVRARHAQASRDYEQKKREWESTETERRIVAERRQRTREAVEHLRALDRDERREALAELEESA